MGTANCIRTADGRSITPPRAIVPYPLTEQLAKAIGERWDHGGNFSQLADALLDQVAHHISTASKLDKRLRDAIEDHLDHDPAEGDVDAESESSIEDIEAYRARSNARTSVVGAHGKYTSAECVAMIGAMLKRPNETARYNQLRDAGLDPAQALAEILQARKEAAVRAREWNGGAL